MILKSRYDEVMESIEVTPAMYHRIMRKLGNVDFTQKQSAVIPFNNYRKFMTIAACFMVLFVGSVFIYDHINDSNQPPPIQIVSGIEECATIDQLSKTVGFEVSQVQSLPFTAEQTQYTSYWEKLAQIMYSGEGNTLAFRMTVGSEDNSGDESEYSNQQTISIDNLVVTLKGQGENYTLAIWHSEGYSYSVNVSNGISQEEMVEIVNSVP